MKALLYKQLRLVAHPTTFVFCLFGSMLMIPAYPYTVAFFYVTLGLFFMFQNGREQRDSDFSALLPIRKRDTVRCAVLFSVLIELLGITIAVPFVLLSAKLRPLGGNAAGVDANVALLGLALLLFAVFNGVFFPSFYRSGYKAGAAFLKASVGVFLVVALDVIAPHPIAWLDGYDPRQWLVLVGGAVIFALVTLLACKTAERRYEKVDL